MSSAKWIAASFIVLTIVPVFSQNSGVSSSASTGKTNSSKEAKTSPVHQSDGKRVFEQNCSRCHDAPQGFAPQISGTIVRHMRVRASLSEKDMQALMRFLNP